MANKPRKSLNLAKTDYILAAWAEPASGPGWSNTPILFLIRSQLDGALRMEYLQPGEQSPEMLTLYRVSTEAHRAMTAAVKRAVVGDA